VHRRQEKDDDRGEGRKQVAAAVYVERQAASAPSEVHNPGTVNVSVVNAINAEAWFTIPAKKAIIGCTATRNAANSW
jgi:hypothetical protein